MTFRPDAVSRSLLVLIFGLLILITAKEFSTSSQPAVTNFQVLDQQYLTEKKTASVSGVIETARKISDSTNSAEPVKKDKIKSAKSGKNETAIININTATLEDLCTLKGIGEKMALRILEYRKSNGHFKSVDDLKNIKGIGEKKFETIKPRIKV